MGCSSSQTIKICHIVDALNIGGLEKNLISIIQETPQFCHSVWCLRKKGVLASILENKGIEVREFNFSGRLRLSGVRLLVKQMRGEKFAVVHCHGLYPSIWGRIAGFMAGVPVRLAHVQNMYDNLAVWQRIKLKLLSYITARCIAVSNAVKNSLVKDINIDLDLITVVYNSSPDILAKDHGSRGALLRELGFSETDLVVGNIGRLEEHKGHKYLIEAIASCRTQGYPCKCLIMGDGWARSGLEQQIKALGLNSEVVILPARTQIEEILLSCDVFVQPSVLREGLPLALAEAASAGLALVATDIGGNNEIVRDGYNGFVVSPKDSAILAQKIGYLTGNPGKRKEMGQNSRALWQEQFSDKVMASKIAAIYEQEISLHSQMKLGQWSNNNLSSGNAACRVLYLHETAHISGAENSLLNLIKNLDREKFEPYFALAESGELAEELDKLKVPYKIIPFPKIRKLIGVRNSIKRLSKFIRLNNIKIIHSNSIRTHIYAAISAKSCRISCIWHQRNMLHKEIIDLDRLFYFLADKIICNSRAIARRFEVRGRLSAKVQVVFNGVDTKKFSPEVEGTGVRNEFGFKPADIVVGIASRFNLQKGHEVFLKAAQEIVYGSDPIKDKIKFLIIGGAVFPEDKQRETCLRDLSNKLGLSKSAVFAGYRKDMPELYAAMDIFVLASEAEPCGRVVLEAMASGKPVIATASGGTPEAVQDGATGMLFKSGDHRDLCHKILLLSHDPELSGKMALAARKRIEENFRIEKNVAGIQDIYQELISLKERSWKA